MCTLRRVTINTVMISVASLRALQTEATFACSFSFPPLLIFQRRLMTPEPRCLPLLRCGEEKKDPARRARAATRAAVSVCGRADSPQQTQVCCCQELCSPSRRQQNVKRGSATQLRLSAGLFFLPPSPLSCKNFTFVTHKH